MKLMIPGPANAVLLSALNLPGGATVDEMVAEIERLKKIAADAQKVKARIGKKKHE